MNVYMDVSTAVHRHADHGVVISDVTRWDLLATYHLPLEKVRVVYEAPTPHFQAAPAFVFLNLYESFRLQLLDVMACGIPVACAASAPLPEIVGDAALTFDPTDFAAIADALRRMIGDEYLWVDGSAHQRPHPRRELLLGSRCVQDAGYLY